jgi:hypothetical protein
MISNNPSMIRVREVHSIEVYGWRKTKSCCVILVPNAWRRIAIQVKHGAAIAYSPAGRVVISWIVYED